MLKEARGTGRSFCHFTSCVPFLTKSFAGDTGVRGFFFTFLKKHFQKNKYTSYYLSVDIFIFPQPYTGIPDFYIVVIHGLT